MSYLFRNSMLRRTALAAVLALSTALSMPDQTQAADTDTLVVGLVAEPVTFDPTQIGDLNTGRVSRRIYQGLTGFEYGTYKLKPQLAESWEISEDGLVYTFHLRPGVTFHDGTPFNAAAVKYSYDRQTDPDHPAHGALTYRYAKNYLGNVASIDVIDDLTVQFTLKTQQAPFLQYLTSGSMGIISPTALEKWGDDIAQHPVGTGPYMMADWEPGVKTVLTAYDGYYEGAPAIKNLVYIPIVEPQARLSAVSTGEVGLTYDVPVESLDMLRDDPMVEIATGLSAHVWYIALDVTLDDPPFSNKLVRQAMNYAVDKEAIVRDILQGTGEVSTSPLAPIYGDAYNPDVKKYPYDPEKAKELLTEAGYPDGFSCDFLVPESGSGMQSPVEMATFIQANLAAVGIDCSIQTMEWGAYLTEYRNKPAMAEMSWNSTMGDPDYVLFRLLHSSAFPPGWNAGSYKNEEVDAMLSEAQVITDEDKRNQLYREAQALIVDDAPWIFVDHGQQIVAYTPALKDFKISPNFDFAFEYMHLE